MTSLLTPATSTETQTLRDQIARLEAHADAVETNAESERDPAVVDRMHFIAADFRERADEFRRRLNARETAAGITKLFGDMP